MSAQVNLSKRSKPPYQPLPVAARDECSFRKVVFHCNILHCLLSDRVGKNAHCCRVAGERPVGECVNLVNRNHSLCGFYGYISKLQLFDPIVAR